MRFFNKVTPDYRGYVNSIGEGRVSGWANDRARPRKRLEVEIFAAGTHLGTTRADMLRPDLAALNFGDGRYGFTFRLPQGNFGAETIAVRVADSDFWLLDGLHDRVGQKLINSARRGLPLLRPGLSTKSVEAADIEIARELQRAWGDCAATLDSAEFVRPDTMWGGIVASQHQVLVDLLRGRDPRPLATFLVDLHKSQVSWGLVQGERAYRDFLAADPAGRRAAIAPFHDMLASLAQYIGVVHAECAEQHRDGVSVAMASEELATKIESALGCGMIVPPVIFDGLYGIAVGEGVLHGRDIQALYAALRVIEASNVGRPSICEIGAGLGAVARYAVLQGVRHYQIVDLPTVCALQFFFLRRTLPDVPVRFRHPAAAARGTEGIDLIFASQLNADARVKADIVLNCDSFPEMGEHICRRYFTTVGGWAPLLLSINQEGNRAIEGTSDRQIVVGDLLPEYGFRRRYRFWSWIRRGFVEELWQAPQGAKGQAQSAD